MARPRNTHKIEAILTLLRACEKPSKIATIFGFSRQALSYYRRKYLKR